MDPTEDGPTAPLSARVPVDLKEYVERRALANHRSVSQELRAILEDARDFESAIARLRYERDLKRAS